MSHEIFALESFAAMEEHLDKNRDTPFTLTGVDLSVLIFLTRTYTYAEIHREHKASVVAKDLFSRLTDQGALK